MLLNKRELLEEIGHGGEGIVYRAAGKKVCKIYFEHEIKEFRIEHKGKPQKYKKKKNL